MDRLARNLDDLRRVVRELTGRGVRGEFVKEQLAFTGEDSPMANLLVSVMGAFAEFERALIREWQAEGIAAAKARGVYKGRRRSLAPGQVRDLIDRAAAGEAKTALAKDFGISRETVYQYLRADGYPLLDDDLARLFPFGRKHVNVIGGYSFTAPDLGPTGVRELRDPDDDDEDD